MPCLYPRLLQRQRVVHAERTSCRVRAARKACHEHKRLGAALGDAHAKTGHDSVHDLVALSRLSGLQSLERAIVENSFRHCFPFALGATLPDAPRTTGNLFRGNARATELTKFNVARRNGMLWLFERKYKHHRPNWR